LAENYQHFEETFLPPSTKTNGITVLLTSTAKRTSSLTGWRSCKELLLRSALDLTPHQCQRTRGNGTMRSFSILSHDLAVKSIRIYGHSAHTGKQYTVYIIIIIIKYHG
jgi:hypothetical protein